MSKIKIKLILIVVIIAQSVFAQEFKLSNYLKADEKDATLAMVTMLEDAAKYKNSKVIIEKGTYHFYPEKAYEKYVFITNHDSSLRRIAFPIINFDGLQLDAQGSMFIFHGIMMPFCIENSKNITVSGFTIDWHIPVHSEALIVATDSVNHTFDIKIADHIPYSIKNEQLLFTKEGYEHGMEHSILYDPIRKSVTYNTNKYTPIKITKPVEIRNKNIFDFPNYIDFRRPEYEAQNQEYALKTKEIERGLVRIYGSKKPLPPIGMVMIFRGRFGTERVANAIHVHKSSNVKFENLTIHHAGGMGILGERSTDITLENVNVIANPTKELLVSTMADAAHFSSCRGQVIVNNCNFRHQLDDAINIHGAYVIVQDILGPNKIGVRIGHFQQGGFEFAQAGDTIGFVDRSKSYEVDFKTTVKAFNKLNKDYYIITLSEDITHKIAKDFVVENVDWYPEVTITNSQFADNRARGLLLKSPKKTIIRNNYFSNMMPGLLISGGINDWWYESGCAQDMLIEGNTFGDCSYSGANEPVITIAGKSKGKGRILGKIIIRNNVFNNFQPSILKARDVTYLEFTNNTINYSKTFPQLYPDEYVLDIKNVKTLKIDKVKISKDFKRKLLTEDITNKSSSIKSAE